LKTKTPLRTGQARTSLRTRAVGWCSHPVNIPGVSFADYESEDAFQIYCADWIRKEGERTGEEHWKFWHHSANEREGVKAGFYAKMKGQSKGYPDFVQHGLKLAIELKISDRVATPEQVRWLRYFESLGYWSEVVYSFDRFKELVTDRIAEQKLAMGKRS